LCFNESYIIKLKVAKGMIQKSNHTGMDFGHSTVVEGGMVPRAIVRARRKGEVLLRWLGKMDVFFIPAGFLLGRAVILSDLAPFILPFFATLYWLNREKKGWAAMAAIAGALSVSVGQAFFSILLLLTFLAVWHALKRWIQHRADRRLPAVVFAVGFAVRILFQAAFTLRVTWTDVLTASAEASLALLVMLIFMQSVPLLFAGVSRRLYKNEEIICFVILLSAVFCGTIGWRVFGVSVDHSLARFAVVLFAASGGAAIGSTVGVVMGLVLGTASVSSLYQMSLLAFSGVLGGLLREAGKTGVATGLMIATLLIGLYGGGYKSIGGEALDSAVAVVLLLATPKAWIGRLASFIPGTQEYQKEERQYIRKLRDVTVGRVEQFAGLFQTLAKSFSPERGNAQEGNERFLRHVAEKTCRNCYKRETCWVRKAAETRRLMLLLKEERKKDPRLRREWKEHCARSAKTMEVIARERRIEDMRRRMLRKVKESRQLVADQLHGVSQVMGDFAEEMKRERGLHDLQEELILSKLTGAGIRVEAVEIYNLNSGAIDIEIALPRDDYGVCEKVIAPLLSDILGELIVVEKKAVADRPDAPCRAAFASARAFEIETGAATAARGGGPVSGDNYALFEAGPGKYALAISDGMGNGERADEESRATLQLLMNVLKSGIHEKLAIKSINSIMALRSTEEIFATLDLALIDLQTAHSDFLKVASHPSFIKRGGRVMMFDSGNLPIGMIEDVDVDIKSEQLRSGDLLIMMSDGIFDARKPIENMEAWIKRKIKELETDNPQEAADLVLEEVIRMAGGRIDDDMTVIAAKIRHRLPEWSAISVSAGERATRRA
jgi:stage II sporulation protein E